MTHYTYIMYNLYMFYNLLQYEYSKCFLIPARTFITAALINNTNIKQYNTIMYSKDRSYSPVNIEIKQK